MLLRRITDFILQSRLQAMAVAFVLAFIPLIGSASILIAAFVTLRKGMFEGALVTFAATIPYLIGYATSASVNAGITHPDLILVIAIISNMLVWLFAALLRLTGNWSVMLEISALAGIIFIMAVHVIHPDIQGWWQAQLNAYFERTTTLVGEATQEPAVAKAMQADIIARAKQYATGLAVISILFNVLLQVVIARWWQAVMFNPGGLRKELHQIQFGYVAAGVFVLASLLSYFGVAAPIDMLPLIYVIFCSAGLSVTHHIITVRQYGWFWLVLLYAGLIALFPASVVILAIIAIFDTFLDFRKRFANMR